MELPTHAGAAVLEGLYEIRGALVPSWIKAVRGDRVGVQSSRFGVHNGRDSAQSVWGRRRGGGDDQECGAFKEDDFGRVACFGKDRQVPVQHGGVGNERVDDVRPCLEKAQRGYRTEAGTHLVETLIVDARAENRDMDIAASLFKLVLPFLKCWLFVSHQIHFVYKKEYGGVGAVLSETVDAVAVVLEVFGFFLRLNVKDVDEHADLLKYSGTLGGEVRVHKGVLASAVPEIENEVSEKADVVLLDVNGGAESGGQRSGEI